MNRLYLILVVAVTALRTLGADWQAEAISAVREGRTQDAIALYQSALESNPTNSLIRKDLMWLLWEHEDYNACALQAEILLSTAPEDVECVELAARSRHRLNDYDAALAHYARALELRPGQLGIELDILRIHEALKDYAAAYDALQSVLKNHPSAPEAWPILGRLLEIHGRYSEAADAWSKAAQAYPEVTDYAFRHAQALHFAGQEEACNEQLLALLESHPDHAASREFLVRMALVDGRINDAIVWLQSQPWEGSARDVPRLLRLAGVQAQAGDHADAIDTLSQALALAPDHSEAMVMQAESLQALNHWAESIELCRKAVRVHPGCIRAWLTLASGYDGAGQPAESAGALEKARTLDPTSPTLLLRQAQALYLADRKAQSRAMLEGWLDRNEPNQSEVPVLLYHGLATSDRDPMLASPIHMTTRRFQEQLTGLREANYHTITFDQLAAWLTDGQSLPPNPVVITFDDGRLDSLREADPVLEETGLGAVMFVAGINADRNLAGYASWNELKTYKAAGRWELQSHGDLASLSIPVNAEGLTGNFLANRQWLPELARMESMDEWQDRIRNDHLSMLDKLAQLASVQATAFAWPEGNYGQQAYVNAPAASERNVALVRELFRLGFQQAGLGVNARSRDPILLERLEPKPEWTGAMLVSQLRARSPTVMILQALLQQALWDRDADQAEHWLNQMVARGLDQNTVLWDSARIDILRGNYAEAELKARRYLSGSTDLEPARIADGWNLIGSANFMAQDYEASEEAYRKSLSIYADQPQTVIELASVQEASRHYARALTLCLELHQSHPEFRKVLPALGRLYDALEQPGQSRLWWSRASEAYPGVTDYAVRAGEAAYADGDHATALDSLNRLLEQHPGQNDARRFLVQCALVRGDVKRALQLLTDCEQLAGCGTPAISLRVARLQVQQGDYKAATARLRELLGSDPGNGEARLLLAECLRLDGHPRQALDLFQSIAEENRASRRAWLGMADAWLDLKEPKRSVEAVRELRLTAPHDPDLVLRQADYAYAAGDHPESAALLQQWLDANPGPALPVLRYHGLATDPADPMLAQTDNHTLATFAAHLEQLRLAGYRTVTCAQVTAWYLHEAELPANALLITFDDGRLDSLRRADPILASNNFQAVMFVDGRNAAGNLPGYASWDELADYQTSGRWDMQSKGTLSSTQIPIDADGRTGLFLVSRRWTNPPGQLETESEWRHRVTMEHESTLGENTRLLGGKPVAFAWPDGDYGQEGIPNLSGAASLNLPLAHEFYALGFTEEGRGLNLQSLDPMRLSRVSPRPHWSGEELVRQLQDGDPTERVLYQLLRYAAWQGRIHEGYRWLEALKQADASPTRLATAEALLRTMAGDPGHAIALLADEGASVSLSQESVSLEKSIARQTRAKVRLWLDGWVDNEDRYTIAIHAGGGGHVLANTRVQVNAGIGEYHQTDVATLSEVSTEVIVEQQLNAFHRLTGELGGHWFEAPAGDTVSWLGRWDASWTDDLRTGLAAEYQPGYTVEMLLDDINYYRAVLDTAWTARDDLRVRVVGRYWSYTDDNDRIDLAAQVNYDLPWIENLQAIYRLTLADTRLEEDAYYTPQQLVQNQLGAEYLWKPSDNLTGRFRYLAGYGIEQGKDGRLVNAFHADLLIRNVLPLEVRPAIDFQQTPTYQLFQFLLMFEKSF